MVERFPRWAVAHGYFRSTLLRIGAVEGAIDALKTAIRLDPEYSYAVQSLVDLLVQDDQPDEAVAVVDSIAEKMDACQVVAWRLQIAAGRDAPADYIATLDAIADDMPYRSWAIRQGSVKATPETAAKLAFQLGDRMLTPTASESIGQAWADVAGLTGISISEFLKFPASPGWNKAAMRLLDLADDLSKETPEASTQAFDRLMKKIRKRMFDDAELFSQVTWNLGNLNRHKEAIALTKKRSKVAGLTGNLLLPGMIAALNDCQFSLLGKLTDEAITDPDGVSPQVKVMRLFHLCFVGTSDDIAGQLQDTVAGNPNLPTRTCRTRICRNGTRRLSTSCKPACEALRRKTRAN